MSQFLDVKSVFQSHCPDLKFDSAFYKSVISLESGFVNKKREHIEFFGGHLTGVHVVRFTTEDRNKLFNEILFVDDIALEFDLHALPAINKEFNVSSDVFNISIIYLLHAVHVSKHLTDDQKFEAKVRLVLYLQYKFLTSRLFQHFRYPANKETAMATYAALSKKYALKVYGSWGATLRARAEEVVNPEGIHGKTIERLDDDYRIVYMINDVQGRIRDMLKNIYNVFLTIHNSGIRIAESSSIIEIDGEMILKDRKNSLADHTRYIHSVFPDKNALIKQELMTVVNEAVDTMYGNMFEVSLSWASDNYTYTTSHLRVSETIAKIIEHAHTYFQENKDLIKHKDDLAGIVKRLKGAYMSSRSTDPMLMQLRIDVSEIIRMATRSKNDSAISSARTGFMLYVVLRAFTMKHYTN